MRRTLLVHGQRTDVGTIEDLAAALGRSPVTVRQWERRGIIPLARIRIPRSHSTPSKLHEFPQRAYTVHQLRLIQRAAQREGLSARRNGRGGLSDRFRADVIAAMREPLPMESTSDVTAAPGSAG